MSNEHKPMDKRIEDYLHLYLGCEVQYLNAEAIISEVSLDSKYGVLYSVKINGSKLHLQTTATKIKPILRPLSDIQNSELVEIINQVSLFHLSECEFEFGEDGERWVNALFGGKVIDSLKLVGDNVEMMNNNGSFSAINPISPVLVWFLKKGFDLFGLIPAGLAIDKTKMNTNG